MSNDNVNDSNRNAFLLKIWVEEIDENSNLIKCRGYIEDLISDKKPVKEDSKKRVYFDSISDLPDKLISLLDVR
jgi:hypothetical protein